MNERKRLIITAIAVGLVGILTGRFLDGDLLPSRGAEQYDERVITSEKALTVVHAHDNISRHEHVIKTVVTTTETTPHGWFHNFAETLGQAAAPVESSAKQGPNEIWIYGREFMPNTLTVPVGTKVTWVNKSVEQHSATSNISLFDSVIYITGSIADSFSYTFTEPGTYYYYCRPHVNGGMTGKIIITGTNVTAPK